MLDDIFYEKLDYLTYQKRINNLLKDNELLNLGFHKNTLGSTLYGYDIDEFLIGNGKKDLFIVGGTHGSEIIGVDFVTQLMKHIPSLNDYDPNLITLHFIPMQNPEGFDITTQTLKSISDENLTQESFDYYLRYRTDNVLNSYLNTLDKLFSNTLGVITPNVFVGVLKTSFNDKTWLNLIDKRAVPEMVNFQNIINNLPECNDFKSLIEETYVRCSNIVGKNPYFKTSLNRLLKSLLSDELWFKIKDHNKIELNKSLGSRLYQEKFANVEISGTQSEVLSQKVNDIYIKNTIPKGSQVKFDPNGSFVNLNKNRIDNPGVKIMKNDYYVYGSTPSNNVLDNNIGPIGTPTVDPYHFEETYENKLLRNLLEKSNNHGRLLGVLLYHGTGGMIYHIPYENTNNSHYIADLIKYNAELADSYYDKTNYIMMNEVNNNAYDDLLRQKYPGVLLIELSKMGGNPIAPYGDQNNIVKTIKSNIEGVNAIIKNCNEKIVQGEVIVK